MLLTPFVSGLLGWRRGRRRPLELRVRLGVVPLLRRLWPVSVHDLQERVGRGRVDLRLTFCLRLGQGIVILGKNKQTPFGKK